MALRNSGLAHPLQLLLTNSKCDALKDDCTGIYSSACDLVALYQADEAFSGEVLAASALRQVEFPLPSPTMASSVALVATTVEWAMNLVALAIF